VLIEYFGLAAVVLMVLFYALENKHYNFVLLFALACMGAAIYAYLIKSYPFMLAEAVWSLIAFNRYRQLRSLDHLQNN